MSSTKDRYVVEVTFEIEKDAEGFPKSRDAVALLGEPLNVDCSLCKVASVPFYLRNVAYGDTISTKDYQPDHMLQFGEVVKRGGYSVYRILLHDLAIKDEVIRKLLDLDALLEQEDNLLAIAVPPTADLDAIVDYILEGKHKGLWGAQDGYVFENS